MHIHELAYIRVRMYVQKGAVSAYMRAHFRADTCIFVPIVSCLCTWDNMSKKQSRVILAIFNESILINEIIDMKNTCNLKQGNGQLVALARGDAIRLSQGKNLKIKTITQ